jgi:hypothetical protein
MITGLVLLPRWVDGHLGVGVGVFLSPLVAGTLLFAVSTEVRGLRRGTQRASLELTPTGLVLETRDLFRVDRVQIAPQAIADVRVCDTGEVHESGWEHDLEVEWIKALQVSSIEPALSRELCTGRDARELEWIAATLRTTLGTVD